MGVKKSRTAIFIHGGAIKGAFGAGFLYGLSQIGIHAADVVIGASSGAATAAYFASGQFDIIKQIWTKEIAKKDFIKYSDILLGRPAFNLEYLIDKLFKDVYPLNTGALFNSATELRIPLCHYPDHSIRVFNNREPLFQKEFWNILHAAVTLHDKQILWKTSWEPYVDADLDPFALYRHVEITTDWNILVINNHHDVGFTIRKWIGLQIFLQLQARHFPREVRTMLQHRVNITRTGLACFEDFKRRYDPMIVLPSKNIRLGPGSVIQRNTQKLGILFEAGVKQALEMREDLRNFRSRSEELGNERSIPTVLTSAANDLSHLGESA